MRGTSRRRPSEDLDLAVPRPARSDVPGDRPLDQERRPCHLYPGGARRRAVRRRQVRCPSLLARPRQGGGPARRLRRPQPRDPPRARAPQVPHGFLFPVLLYRVQVHGLRRRREREGRRDRPPDRQSPSSPTRSWPPGACPRARASNTPSTDIRRKDGVCVGIYAQHAIDQIRQNATFTGLLSA